MHPFQDLGVTHDTLNAIAAMGFEEPTPVQSEAIPPMLKGRDALVQARTGTGKTAAFGIPLVEALRQERHDGVLALVLVPTRELCIQVAEQLDLLAKGSPLSIVTVYGGVGFGKQTDQLTRRGPKVVVATPGRLLDHLGRRTLRLDAVSFLVLDEADRMLDMGFLPDVEQILETVPQDRQTGLFSATMPDPIRRLVHRFQRDPVTIRVESGPAATPLAEQFRIDVVKMQKTQALLALLKRESPERAIVFTRTKHLARRLADNLHKSGFQAVSLQGNMSQGARDRALGLFRRGKARVLVATDVASRGLDVPEVTHVINYDIPEEGDVYVHRIGRTARMGRAGRAFTFVEPGQRRDLSDVEKTAGATLAIFELEGIPTLAEMPPERQHHQNRPQQRGRGGGGRGRYRGGGQRGGPNQGRSGGGNRSFKGGRRQGPGRDRNSNRSGAYGGGAYGGGGNGGYGGRN